MPRSVRRDQRFGVALVATVAMPSRAAWSPAAPLGVPPPGRALLEEGADALGLVLGAEQVHETLALRPQRMARGTGSYQVRSLYNPRA